MFVIFLRFSDNRDKAGEFMEGHKTWLRNGFEDGKFVLAGSIAPGLGGAILAHNTDLASLEKMVAADPFVAENVVSPEIVEISANMTDARLEFLKS